MVCRRYLHLALPGVWSYRPIHLKSLVLPGAEDEAMGYVVGVENPADDLSGVVNGGGACALEIAGAALRGIEGLDVAIGETDKTVVGAVGVDRDTGYFFPGVQCEGCGTECAFRSGDVEKGGLAIGLLEISGGRASRGYKISCDGTARIDSPDQGKWRRN